MSSTLSGIVQHSTMPTPPLPPNEAALARLEGTTTHPAPIELILMRMERKLDHCLAALDGTDRR